MEVLIALVLIACPLALVTLFVAALLKPEIRDRLANTARTASGSLPGRLGLMTLTGVLLLIPLSMVEDLRQERRYRLTEVQDELANEWGARQRVVGPMLWVPVLDHSHERFEKTDKDGNVKVHQRPKVVQREFLILPQDLSIQGDVEPQALHRGLYDVLVYNAEVQMTASFGRPELPTRSGHELEVLWHEAQLLVQLSDLSAVSAVTALDWQGEPLKPESATMPGHPHHAGIRGTLPSFNGEEANVRIALDLRGMAALMVGALGETNAIEIAGNWDAPSFTGFTLPKHRTVEDSGFTGTWAVPGVARPLPHLIEMGPETDLNSLFAHTVGVRLVEPASPYVSVERALTYGVLVIVLCLLTFLVLEHGLNLKLHPVQWLVNGLALVVFYLVLLATSEHQGFQFAYGVATSVTIGLISVYILFSTWSIRAAATALTSLTVLYGCMFSMLRSEDYALLTGTALVVLALAATMWVTRHLGRAATEATEIPARPSV
jgi:inner membrane protein